MLLITISCSTVQATPPPDCTKTERNMDAFIMVLLVSKLFFGFCVQISVVC